MGRRKVRKIVEAAKAALRWIGRALGYFQVVGGDLGVAEKALKRVSKWNTVVSDALQKAYDIESTLGAQTEFYAKLEDAYSKRQGIGDPEEGGLTYEEVRYHLAIKKQVWDKLWREFKKAG